MELEQRRNDQGRIFDVIVQLSGEGLSSRLDAVRRARHSDRRRRARDHFTTTVETRADIAGQFTPGNQPSTQGEVEPQSKTSSAGNRHPPTARTCSTSHPSSSLASTADSTASRDVSVNFDTMRPEAEFDWVENLLDFVATSAEPEASIRSRDDSSASTPLERDINLGTEAETTEHTNSSALENEGRDDINDSDTSSTTTSQRQEGSSSSSSSSSSSTPPSHLLNIEDVARSLSALLMANTTLPPDQVARIIARWHRVSASQLFVVEAMTLAAMTMENVLCDRLLSISQVAAGTNDALYFALASIFAEITLHRQRNLNRDFHDMFPELQALDYPIEID
jgi:hypothetical protein